MEHDIPQSQTDDTIEFQPKAHTLLKKELEGLEKVLACRARQT